MRGWRTLLVDVDPQGSVGYSLSERVASAPGIAQLLAGVADLDGILLSTRLDTFTLLPAGDDAPEMFASHAGPIESGEFFRELLDALATREFDLVLFDTPSGIHGSSKGLIGQVDYLLIPVQIEPLSARTLPRLLGTLSHLVESGRAISIAGILFTMGDASMPESGQLTAELASLLPAEAVFEHSVVRDPAFVQASARGVPLAMLHRPPPPAAMIFDWIAVELEQRLGLVEPSPHEQLVRLVD
jgi:chromosome partitioning protein